MTASVEDDARAARVALILSAIDFFERDGSVMLSLGRCFQSCIGLKIRQTQARRYLKSAVKRYCLLRWQSVSTASVLITDTRIEPDRFREMVAAHLAEVAGQPLTPRFLVAALGITSRERVRWTKDGRLKSSGSITIDRGQRIFVPVYAIEDVEILVSNPGILDRWRTDDREALCVGRSCEAGPGRI